MFHKHKYINDIVEVVIQELLDRGGVQRRTVRRRGLREYFLFLIFLVKVKLTQKKLIRKLERLAFCIFILRVFFFEFVYF